MASLADRLPPQCIEAEEYVLGAMMLNADAVREVMPILDAGQFYREDHRVVFQAIIGLNDRQQPTDAMAVQIELERRDRLKGIGGSETLENLLERAPHSCNAVYHAHIIRQKAVLRELIATFERGMKEAYRLDADAAAVLASAESEIYALANMAASEQPSSMMEIMNEAQARIEARVKGNLLGVPTGLTAVDDMLNGGLANGELIIVAARPSMGKTALALGFCEHAAITGDTPALLVSLEMGKGELGERLLTSHAKIDGHLLKSPWKLNGSHWERLGRSAATLQHQPLWVDDAPTRSMAQIVAIARREKAYRKIGFLGIDYLQLIDGTGTGDRGQSRQEVVSQISRRAKMLAKELSIPVVLLSQLNRECESRPDKRPIMSDLRESGAIEQDADVVLLLHRPDYYDPNEKPGLAELIVAKQRNGATGKVDLTFLKSQARFANYSPDRDQQF